MAESIKKTLKFKSLNLKIPGIEAATSWLVVRQVDLSAKEAIIIIIIIIIIIAIIMDNLNNFFSWSCYTYISLDFNCL